MIATPEGWDLDRRGQRRITVSWEDQSRHEVRLGCAFHEAGHAVLGLQFGFPLREVYSGEAQPAPGGPSAFTGGTVWDAYNAPWQDYVMVCAAGSRAHALYMQDAGLWRPEYADLVTAPHDVQDAVDGAATCGVTITTDGTVPDGDDRVPWHEIEAEADKELRAAWSTVCALATELYARERLSGARVREITGLPGTEVTA